MERVTLAQVFGLRGQRALVTGASSGLGVELAEALAIAGADLVLVARREARLREVAGRLQGYGNRIVVIAQDITSPDAAASIFDRAEADLGPIDVLVNNAGVHQAVRAEKIRPEQWREVFDVNLNAVFSLSQEFARRRFLAGAPGRIVNVSSIFGAVASSMPGVSAYVAAKGAVTMLTRQLAIEWGPRGITVNALAPGFFPTELNVEDLGIPEVRSRIESFTPLGRMGRSGELRAAILFLAAPTASYVTGSTVFVDGGYTAW